MAKTTSKKTSRQSTSAGSSRGRKLVVVESPAKAKTINRYLGNEYVVKASMGHVRDLPKSDFGVDVEHGFAPTYIVVQGRKKIVSELSKLAGPASEIFLATDLDREGEAIAWHLAESLDLPPEKVRRVVFNEITASAIRESFSHPRDINMDMVNAQQARRILDRLVGYKVSPLLWRKVATGLSAGRVQTVSVRLIVEREAEIGAFTPEEYWRIGGVFTPDVAGGEALRQQWFAFLAQRDENGKPPTQASQQEFLGEHQAFRAELATWKGQRFKVSQSEQALEVVRALRLELPEIRRTEDADAKGPARNVVEVTARISPDTLPFEISRLARRESTSRPPAPFATATLQQTASVRLRFGAQRTMRIAQQLYEGVEVPGEGTVGLITYMRTDSTHLSQDSLQTVREMIQRQFGGNYLPGKPNFFAAGKRAQEAHEAIRPTDPNRSPDDLRSSLTDEQYKLYRMIWQRFVACQMTPAVWLVTEADLTARTPEGEAVFKAMGRTLKFDGYMRVAGLPRTGEQILPDLQENQRVVPLEIQPVQHFTQPPPRYTEASLVKAMEAEGIGRPSTYAAIIQTIQDRQYVTLEDRSFRPTDLGTVVTNKLVQHFPQLFDVRFTAHLEDELDKVEDATADWREVLRQFYEPFEENLEKAAENMVHAKAETEPSEYACDTCGLPMVYRFSKSGRYLACTGYPDCKQTNPVDEQGRKVERKEVDVQCPQCGSAMILRRSRFGPFLGCSAYPNCKTTIPCDAEGNPRKLVKPEELQELCPECDAKMDVKWKGRRAFLGCSRYPECRTSMPIPDDIYLEPPPKVEPEKAGVNCPKCGREMLIREGKRGKFIACSGFPKCRNAMDLSKLDDLKARQEAGETAPPTEAGKPKRKAARKSTKKTAKKATRKTTKTTSRKAAAKPADQPAPANPDDAASENSNA